ncbi:MAG: hypothetical protein L0219_09960 [Phycisphaerales bacterium]|nr:hypothetical protein [Phycisphaerales bacterium]
MILAAFDVRINRAIAEIPDADEPDFADAARGDDLAGFPEMIAAASLIADLHDLLRSFDPGRHLLAFRDGASQSIMPG